jgi:hypothetical protein
VLGEVALEAADAEGPQEPKEVLVLRVELGLYGFAERESYGMNLGSFTARRSELILSSKRVNFLKGALI